MPQITLWQIDGDVWAVDINSFDISRMNTAEYEVETLLEIIKCIHKQQYEIRQNIFGKYMIIHTLTAGKFRLKYIK